MLVYIKKPFRLNDEEIDVTTGQLLEVSDETGKKIVGKGYGHKVEITKVGEDGSEPQEEPLEDKTIEELKVLLDEKGIEYQSKAKKADLIKLMEG